MFRSKFIKFLLSILDWQVISSSNFASFFVIMTHNSPVNLKLIHFLLWIKGSHQSANFEALKWSGENFPNFSCHFPNHKSVFLQILHDALVSWKITLLAQTFYTLVKSIPWKYKFLRLSSAQVKIRQITYVTFETTSQLLFKVFIILQRHCTQLFCKFVAHLFSTLD